MKVKGREQTPLSDDTEKSAKIGLETLLKDQREAEAMLVRNIC